MQTQRVQQVRQVISSATALTGRKKLVNPNSGAARWRTPFLGGAGTREPTEVRCSPMGFLIEMTPDSVLPPHFHPVDQFQVFVSGSGLLGKHGAAPLSVHYADRHTAYGPITAGPQGVAYFTLRARNDARGMFLHKPGAREQLRPSKRRFRLVENIVLAVPPVLMELPASTTENLMPDEEGGLAAYMMRLGAGQSAQGPSPVGSDGQFYLIVSGGLSNSGGDSGVELPVWSMLYAGPDDAAPVLHAGAAGCEVLVMQFPQCDLHEVH